MDMSKSRRIVILGKSGAGKSSLGNTIFGEKLFKIGHSLDSTRECQVETKSVHGRSITLIDTPDFFDTDRSEEEMKPEIVRCITECASGPHAFLIVLKVEKITEHEQAVITKISQYFSEEVFKYATVVFTHGDHLREGETIEDFVCQYKMMSDLVNKCGSHCHVVDNKYWENDQQDEYRNNQFQVKELLTTIDTITEANKGSCYTNEMLQVEKEIQQEEACIRQSTSATSALFSALFGLMKRMRGAGTLKTTDDMAARKAAGAESELAGAVKGGDATYDAASNTLRLVILGKTGAGKSSLANTIFGENDRFKIGHGVNSETRECQADTKSLNGKSITLIDTPGFFDTVRSEKEMKPAIVRCITECAPGPHVVLIVLKVEKLTEHEQAVITKIRQYFSEIVFRYAIVLFTHGDQLPEGEKIEDFVCQNEIMSDLVNKCGGRCHVIDNRYWKNIQQDEYRNNKFHVERILTSIDKTLEANKGSCYTNEMLQAVEEELKKEEARIRQSSGNMSEEEIREQAKGSVVLNFLIKLAGAATGALLSAFFGVKTTMIYPFLEKGAGPKMDGTPEQKAEGAAGAESALAGAVKGGDAGTSIAE